MPLSDILRRASTFIMGSEETKTAEYEDNEVLFCKNNVCVHPPAMVRQDTDVLHHPGYLTITTKTFVDQYNEARRPTLFLTWIPNSTLRKCPGALQNCASPVRNNYYNSLKNASTESLASSDSNNSERPVEMKSTNPFLSEEEKVDVQEMSSDESDKSGTIISINVDISSPEIEIITTPDSVKDITESLEKLSFSR